MATDMLQSEGAEAHMLPSLPAVLPGRVFNRGPEYFRKQAENGQPKRLSAVERLEADKAKYVKSQEVINAKQEPIKAVPPSGHAGPPLHGSGQDGGSTSEKKKANLNLEILCNLLNSPEGCVTGQRLGNRARSWAPQRSHSSELHRRSFAESLRVFPTHIANLNLSAGLLQEHPPPEALLHLSFSSSDVRLPLCAKSDPSRPPHASSRRPSDGTVPWRLSLTRSKSDLSECYARTGANVERFFNYCGLDPGELDGLAVVESLTRAGSDIISLNLCSASVLSSECGRSLHSNENLTDNQDPDDRVPCGISAVERNARIIKWLYSIKQARESQRVSHV